jgi:Zn-dependent peptidase ImmA (M78 family)
MPNHVREGSAGAQKLRKRLKLSASGPLDVGWVARELDLVVVRRPLSPLSGIHLAHSSGRSFVAVNSDDIATRQNFTLAHEIAHHIFDGSATIAEKIDVADAAPVEMRANAFAAELILPTCAIREWRQTPHLSITPDEIARLAVDYQLSYLATLFRLKSTGVIDDVNGYYEERSQVNRSLRDQLNRPGEERSSLPSDFLRMADAALERSIISRRRHHELTSLEAREDDF